MTYKYSLILLACFACVLSLSGCGGLPSDTAPLRLNAVDFKDLPNWENDNHAEAIPAFQKTCERIKQKDPKMPVTPDNFAGLEPI